MMSTKPKGSVPALERAIFVLDALAASPAPLSLAALTARVGLAKSTVLGICSTLVHAGLLARRADGAYQLGVRLVDLAHAYLAKADVTSEFVASFESLPPMPEETVVLAVLDGRDVVYVACRNGSHGLSLNYRIGMRLPATCTASGKALLATMSDADVRESVGSSLTSLTEQSIVSMPELLADLAGARERGYATDREETRAGMCCIGAPVFDASRRQAIAAVAISLVSVEFDSPKRNKTVARVKDLAAHLSTRLGAAGYVTGNN